MRKSIWYYTTRPDNGIYECLRVSQIHTEFVEQLAQLTDLCATYPLSRTENLFFDAIGEGVALGIKANKKYEPIIATCWADFGWKVLEVVKGIGEGVVLGTYNTACFAKNIVCHPIRTTSEIVHGIGTIVCAAGKAVGISVQLGVLCVTGDTEQAYKETQEIYEHTKFVMQNCATKIAAMSNREIAKQTTAFATDWFLTGKALTFGHSICSRAGPLLAEAIEVLHKEPAVAYAVAGSEGMLHHMSETTKHVGGAAKEIVRDSQLFLKTFHAEHMAKLELEIAQLRKIFDCTIKGFAECANKYLKLDYKHILGIDLWFDRKGITKLEGFHHDFMEIIEKSGVIKFVNKTVYTAGFYKATLVGDGLRALKKSFFPAEWTREKVISKIYEAYENFVKNGGIPKLEHNGTYKIQSCIQEGVEIEMYITKKGKILTAYPILE
jgi:hypothetical protein